jgi:hypothetical protein
MQTKLLGKIVNSLFRLFSFRPFRLPLNLMKSVFVYKSVLGQRAVKKINRSRAGAKSQQHQITHNNALSTVCVYCIYLFVWEPPGSGLLVLLQCSVCVLCSLPLPAIPHRRRSYATGTDAVTGSLPTLLSNVAEGKKQLTLSPPAHTLARWPALISSTAKLI